MITDKRLIEYDKQLTSTMEEIERRISATNYAKVDDLIKYLMKLSAEVGEYVVMQRISINSKGEEE